MPARPHEILLVTPVWNDSARLADFGTQLAAALADSPLAIHWVIADDGSAARDHAPLRELRDVFGEIFPRVHLHLAERHHGVDAAAGSRVARLRGRRRQRHSG
jgi:hypothetical protein